MPTEWGREIIRVSPLFLLMTTPAVRIWAGNGWLEVAADDTDTEGGRYLGAGQLVSLPTVSALINGLAERVEFGLSGAAITSRVVELADEEAPSVRGVDAYIGLIGFDENEQPTTIRWPWSGRADSTQIHFDSNGFVPSRQVSLSVGSLFTFRQQAALGYWVGPDQKRRSIDDRYCERVPSLSVETQKPWPRN